MAAAAPPPAPPPPFGVSARMETLGASSVLARRSTPHRTLLVTAFLMPESGSSTHTKGSLGPAVGGSSSNASRSKVLFKLVDKLAERSPGLCDANVTVVVLHNLPADERLPAMVRHGPFETSRRRLGVEYVRASLTGPLRLMSPLNARFVLLRLLLARTRWWDCAYSFDLSDVDVLRAPPCGALRPTELVLGTDACSNGMRKWLAGRLERSGMLRDDSGRYGAGVGLGTFGGQSARQLLSRGRGGCIYSAALVGGRRSAFGPALRNVTDQLTANYERRLATKQGLTPNGAVQYWAEDMVAWNLLAQEHPRESLLLGYPHGPTNLPMYGGLSSAHLDPGKTAAAGEQPPQCWGSEACRQGWLRNAGSRSLYWFGHKMPASWRYLLMDPECRRNRTRITTGRRKGAFEGWFWKIPRRSCTLPNCRGGEG